MFIVETEYKKERAEMLVPVGLCIGEIARSNNSFLLLESTVTSALHLAERSNYSSYVENKFVMDVLGEIALVLPEWISPHMERVIKTIEKAAPVDDVAGLEQYLESVLGALIALVQGI